MAKGPSLASHAMRSACDLQVIGSRLSEGNERLFEAVIHFLPHPSFFGLRKSKDADVAVDDVRRTYSWDEEESFSYIFRHRQKVRCKNIPLPSSELSPIWAVSQLGPPEKAAHADLLVLSR